MAPSRGDAHTHRRGEPALPTPPERSAFLLSADERPSKDGGGAEQDGGGMEVRFTPADRLRRRTRLSGRYGAASAPSHLFKHVELCCFSCSAKPPLNASSASAGPSKREVLVGARKSSSLITNLVISGEKNAVDDELNPRRAT